MLNSLFFKLAVAVVYGLVVGGTAFPLSKKLASSRTDDPSKLAPLLKASVRALVIVLAVGASTGVTLIADMSDAVGVGEWIRNLILLIPIFNISVIDSLVRKIPNPLLLVMIVVEAVYITYASIKTAELTMLLGAVIGFVVGTVTCLIPSLLRIPMGAGDIKYNAVLGMCLGAVNYLFAMFFMAFSVSIAFVYLKLSKKGGMKTLIPMGPFISLGAVVAICLPLAQLISALHVSI